tara:strand:+ start:3205 stop:3711 length:507 start_codon:yes stop_codon:yes gene_type:complete
MFNRIISAVLCLSLCINNVMAQENQTDDNWDLSGAMIWQPEQKQLKFGSLELTVWILPQQGMTAPDAGYLLYRRDVGQLLERMNNFQGRIDDIVAEERSSCDTQLVECRESCKRQNTELRTNFDSKVSEITILNTNITTLEENVLLYKILAGVGGVAALSLGIFALSK